MEKYEHKKKDEKGFQEIIVIFINVVWELGWRKKDPEKQSCMI